MTNINCAESCKYQQDGKCVFDTIVFSHVNSVSGNSCAYFVPSSNCQPYEQPFTLETF